MRKDRVEVGMGKEILIDREAQQAMRDRVEKMIRETATYEGIRKELHNMGFWAEEDNPALALWESGEYELFVVVHMDPDTGKLRDYAVSTFEETEGGD
jgi:hypothetical protein